MKSRLDKNKSTYKAITLAILILVVVLIFSTNFFRSYVSDLISNSYTKLFINQNEYTNLLEENNNLKNKLEELNIQISSRQDLNQLVREGMVDVIKANSILRSDKINFVYSEVLINKGERDGASLGDIVMLAGLSPVGYISKLNSASSVVTLYSANGNTVEVLLEVTLSKEKENENENENLADDIDFASSSSTSSSRVDPQILVNKSLEVKNLYSLEAVGDGKFGLLIKADYALMIATGSVVYLKSNPDYKLGSIVNIENNESTKEKYLYVKPDFSIINSSILYILK